MIRVDGDHWIKAVSITNCKKSILQSTFVVV